MALTLNISIRKLTSNGISSRLCKAVTNKNVTKVACISSKATRADRNTIGRPAPFPYERKRYNLLQQFIDPMMERFDDNSKIVVVEGPIAAGKDKFARQLAEQLEMKYLSPPSFDLLYINDYGMDYRDLNHLVSPKLQGFDVPKFLTNPNHIKVPSFQIEYYGLKWNQYLHALLHVLSTGEGVVLNRCCYSDYVFMKTLLKHGYVSKNVYSFYEKVLDNCHSESLRPHLIVYLDVPVKTVKERIQKRNLDYEVKSKVLTDDYLSSIEKFYKDDYLKNISEHSHVLMYNWTEEGDVNDIVGDIEHLDFDSYGRFDKKMRDWYFETVAELQDYREFYDDEWNCLLQTFNHISYEADELLASGEENGEQFELLQRIPGWTHEAGFDRRMGDNILFRYADSRSSRYELKKQLTEEKKSV